MSEYQSPQEREAERRRQVAEEQQRERNLKDSTRERESRFCKYPGCGRGFWVPPQSKRRYCSLHEGRV